MPAILFPLAILLIFFREIGDVFSDRRRLSLLLWIGILFGTGTIYYARVEQWSYTDALYFSVITLATVGFGDLTPTTVGAKMFTIVYILVGLGIFVSFINTLAKDRERIIEQRYKRSPDWNVE